LGGGKGRGKRRGTVRKNAFRTKAGKKPKERGNIGAKREKKKKKKVR